MPISPRQQICNLFRGRLLATHRHLLPQKKGGRRRCTAKIHRRVRDTTSHQHTHDAERRRRRVPRRVQRRVPHPRHSAAVLRPRDASTKLGGRADLAHHLLLLDSNAPGRATSSLLLGGRSNSRSLCEEQNLQLLHGLHPRRKTHPFRSAVVPEARPLPSSSVGQPSVRTRTTRQTQGLRPQEKARRPCSPRRLRGLHPELQSVDLL